MESPSSSNLSGPGNTVSPHSLQSLRFSTNVDPEKVSNSHSQGNFLDQWRILWRHKTAIILSSLSGLLIGFGMGVPMKPAYRARTSLEVLNLNEDFMNMKQANPVTNDSSSDTSEIQTQIQLLESRSVQNRVVDKLSAPETSDKLKLPIISWRSWFHLPEPAHINERRASLNAIATTLKVHATGRTSIIEATVESTNPQLAAAFVNTLVQEYIQQNLDAHFAATHRTNDWLTREINDARDHLKASENTLQAYARDSGLVFLDVNTNVATEKLQQLQQHLSGATADRISRQARFELARNSPPDTLADVLSDTGLKSIVAKITDLRSQIADLGAVYNPAFSKIKRSEAELAVLQHSFEQTRADIIKRIENDYQEASSREKLLAAAYDAQTREVSGQDEKAIQYNILKREVDSSSQLFNTMLQQTKQSSIASALRASNIRVVDPAEVPDVKFSPNFTRNSELGFLAGLLLSVTLVTIRERADRTFQKPGDIRIWTGLQELGTIPSSASENKKRLSHGVTPKATVRAPETNMPSSSSGRNAHVELVTWQQKPSYIAEAFRSTLTSILFVGENGTRPGVFVVTSAHPSDGKTTIVCNLAIAAAEIKRKVLVIDADLRNPRVHQIFNVPNDCGLADVLRGEFRDRTTADLIQDTGNPHIHLLTAGTPTDAAVHLLYSRSFADLLVRFRQEYEIVLIDTPPMLQMTDARVVGRLSDGIILVARYGKTSRDAILAAKERLAGDSIPVLGTILNGWDPSRVGGGSYGQYKYDV